jgi:hypothetical protein
VRPQSAPLRDESRTLGRAIEVQGATIGVAARTNVTVLAPVARSPRRRMKHRSNLE